MVQFLERGSQIVTDKEILIQNAVTSLMTSDPPCRESSTIIVMDSERTEVPHTQNVIDENRHI